VFIPGNREDRRTEREERAAKAAAKSPAGPKLSEDDRREFVGLVGQIEPRRLSSVLEYMRLLANEVRS
jgi:hypothetical protein